MVYNNIRVPCAVCRQDISKLSPSLKIGFCNKCQKVFCPRCLSDLKKKKCPICQRKLELKFPIQKWPKKWRPILSLQSDLSTNHSKTQDFSQQLIHQTQKNKFCRVCNRKLRSDSRYCDLCGKLIN